MTLLSQIAVSRVAASRVAVTRRAERGSGGVELAVAFTSLLLVMFFVVGALRVSNTRSDVSAAARSAARAAAGSYDQAEAQQAAQGVANDALAAKGVACQNLSVTVSALYDPGSIVTATVTCTVDLSDVALVGFPGTETVQASAVELVDVVRGGGG